MTPSTAIMVVDDDPGFLELMSYLLSGERYQVVLHPQSVTALEEIRRQQPDLVILDLAMPEKTGWKVLEELKADSTTGSIPVIICTAAVQEAERKRALVSALNVRTILKPFDVGELLTLIESVLKARPVELVTIPVPVTDRVAVAEQSVGVQRGYEVSNE